MTPEEKSRLREFVQNAVVLMIVASEPVESPIPGMNIAVCPYLPEGTIWLVDPTKFELKLAVHGWRK